MKMLGQLSLCAEDSKHALYSVNNKKVKPKSFLERENQVPNNNHKLTVPNILTECHGYYLLSLTSCRFSNEI